MALKNRPSGLGRGLDAIFDIDSPPAVKRSSATNGASSSVVELELSKIDPNPEQPRTNFDVATIDELAQSIASLGIIQPLTVKEADYGRYTIISGERRFRAARKAGLSTVPVYVRKADDRKTLEMALVENIQREDLNPLEIAISLNRLINECKITQEILSERVGKNRATISNYIRLLKLSPTIQHSLSVGDITMGHAKALLSVDSVTKQELILHKITKESLSVRQTELLVKNLTEKAEEEVVGKIKTKIELPQTLKRFETKLESLLGKKIAVSRTEKGESRVVISFKNDSEIEEILNNFNI